jgi:hypothetical protein
MAEFFLTIGIMTVASCQSGETDRSGYVDCLGRVWDTSDQAPWDLSEVIAQCKGRIPEGSGGMLPDWITFESLSDDWLIPADSWSVWRFMGMPETVAVTVAVHRPRELTDASWGRVLRLLGWQYRY